jgi:hypothetical protein
MAGATDFWKVIQKFAGCALKEFTRLLPAFERVYGRKYPSKKTRAGKARKRKAGGGRKGNLHGVEQKLLFALVYQKTYYATSASVG